MAKNSASLLLRRLAGGRGRQALRPLPERHSMLLLHRDSQGTAHASESLNVQGREGHSTIWRPGRSPQHALRPFMELPTVTSPPGSPWSDVALNVCPLPHRLCGRQAFRPDGVLGSGRWGRQHWPSHALQESSVVGATAPVPMQRGGQGSSGNTLAAARRAGDLPKAPDQNSCSLIAKGHSVD
jgi:hypothetical protein